ncbi:MAG TPA: hypothetical protein ENJ89_10595 [Caldithrix abyssi]|uniref:Outer membrane protein beta-barrel domain-containing protein n=1 Tax=Caldithrix abyssi TaxID=187145 RepID=A0A7V5PR11_CALAY|nr:hypothetical protein [Caldithrix abyssi]
MKNKLFVLTAFLLILSIPVSSWAQFKRDSGQPDFSSILGQGQSGLYLGFIDPEKMQIHHSFSMSYGAGAGYGMMLAAYMNTIDYQISEKLFLRTNLGIMTSPYNSFGKDSFLNKPQFFGGADLTYKINNNTKIHLGVHRTPFGYYDPYYPNALYNPSPLR